MDLVHDIDIDKYCVKMIIDWDMDNGIKYSISEDIITFYKEGWNSVGKIDNNDKLFQIVKAHTWHDDKQGYLYCSKLKKYLHRLVIELQIGEDRLKDLTKQGFVIDHINNDERHNCCLDNLNLIKSSLNKAKGLTIDKDIENIRLTAGIGLYCLKNGLFQIAVGINDKSLIVIKHNKPIDVSVIYLTFDSFEKCYHSLGLILLWLKNPNGFFDLNKMDTVNLDFRERDCVRATEEEIKKDFSVIIRGDKVYFKQNNQPGAKLAIIHKPAKKE